VVAPLPADLTLCFSKTTPKPDPAKPMTRADVLRLIARLRRSEMELTACGKRLQAFYNQILNAQNNNNKNKENDK